jgi:hypothetical protein
VENKPLRDIYKCSFYYNKMNPIIEQSLTSEQREEVKRIVKSAIMKPSPKIFQKNITFGFSKRYYLTLLVGPEKRRDKIEGSLDIWGILLMIMLMIILSIVALAIFAASVKFLYIFKSTLGVDLFDWHLFTS